MLGVGFNTSSKSWTSRSVNTRCKFKCVCGKGFGSVNKKEKDDTKAMDKKAVKQAMKDIKRGKGRSVRPIDPQEAAQGKVDYATVQGWGTEDKQLEELEVKDFRSIPQNQNLPFSRVLAQHLDQLQRNGSLDLVNPDGGAFPSFDKWAFQRRHYVQYLMDLQMLHQSLEQAVQFSLKNNQTGQTLLKDFWKDKQWERSEIVASDLQKFKQSIHDEDFSLMKVSKQIEVYCKELIRKGQSQQEDKALKLIAHIYAVFTSTLGQGVRIGAVVVEKLSLVQIDAIDIYRKWPQEINDPFKDMCKFIDQIGEQITDEQKEIIQNEVGIAFLESTRVLQNLAKEK